MSTHTHTHIYLSPINDNSRRVFWGMVTAGKVIWVLVECDFAGTVFTVQGELAAGFALNQQRKAERTCARKHPPGLRKTALQLLARVWAFVVGQFSSVHFSSSVLYDSLQPRWLQQARLPCPSPTPGAYSKLMSIESVMPSNHLILCRPLLLLPSIFPSIRVFSNESALCIRWPKYWCFSFSISPSSEHPGLISFRMDWLDLLAVQGTLKNLLQHHSSKAWILPHSAFFVVQLSHPYRTR